MLNIRKETPLDFNLIDEVTSLAFKNHQKNQLIQALRKNDAFKEELSLVATENEIVIGYLLLFPTYIINDYRRHSTLILASMAVMPDRQKQGIGAALIKEAMKQGEKIGFGSIVLSENSEYFFRFGFKKASRWNITMPMNTSNETVLAVELNRQGFSQVSGTVYIPEEFNSPLYENKR
jgi:putative acetyltransferase